MTPDPRLPALRAINPAFAEAEAQTAKSRDDPTGEQARLRNILARQEMRAESLAMAGRAEQRAKEKTNAR